MWKVHSAADEQLLEALGESKSSTYLFKHSCSLIVNYCTTKISVRQSA